MSQVAQHTPESPQTLESSPQTPPSLVPPVIQFLPDSPHTPHTPQRLVTSDPVVEHPSPPSSSGSNKRIADSDVSELVRRAKASRYNNQPPRQNGDDIVDILERDLSCAICSEVLANPVACLDCLHRFCGSCLVPWFARSDTCPTCRRTVKGTRDDHNAASLTETILGHFPDQKRNPDELKELELIYKPGQKINITNTYSDEDDEPDPEEEEEEDDGITWPPCPCCVRPNPHNFACPDPIPSPDPVRGPVRVDVYSYRSHLRCQSCPNTFPTAWKPGWKCENCGILNCGNLFQCDLQGVLRPTADQVVNLNILGGLTTTYFDGNALTLPNFINNVELALFHAWMTTNQVTWRDVGMKIYTFLRVKYDNMVPFAVKPLRPEDFACQPCTVQALRANFVSWWIHERESTGYVDNRTRCWYGRGCRTQVHNPDHARRLVHACDETPAVGRRAHAPPMDGGVAMGAGAPGDGVMGDGGFMGVAAAGGGGDESGGGGAADGDGAAGGGGDGGGGGGGGE